MKSAAKMILSDSRRRAMIRARNKGILVKPMTAALIKRGRGILKRQAGDKPLRAVRAEHRKRERDIEDRYAR